VQRKAQEVAERERMLVRLALEMIDRYGFHNLTLGAAGRGGGLLQGNGLQPLHLS
jgi:hypothetical protein